MNLGFTKKKVGKKYIVLCGNYQEFNVFCDIQMKNYEDGETFFEGDEFFYYSSPDSIRGIRVDGGIIEYGTFMDRKDIDYDYLRMLVNRK